MIDIQIDGQTENQIDGQKDRQTDKHENIAQNQGMRLQKCHMYIGNYDSLWMGVGANQNTSVVKIKRDKRKQIYLKKRISYIEKPYLKS